MYIKKLNLRNFRNYEALELDEISNSRVVLIGDNAQGKSNLLEAISILAFGSSYRASKENEVIGWSGNESGIYTELHTSVSTKELTLILRKHAPKTIKVDNVNVKRMAKFIGNVKIVLFSAEDLQLVKGSPSERRNFSDKLLVQVESGFYHQLQVYNKILQHRNQVLKQLKEGNKQDLSIWNEQIVDISVNIYELRLKLINRISELVDSYHQKIANPDEKVSVKYISSISGLDLNNFDRDNLKKYILEFLEKNQYKEVARGQSLYGPHRDDIEFSINGHEAKLYASQGQQRTLVLSLKLSEIMYIKEMTGEIPILLLDDVMAELDHTRQKHLLELVGLDTQTFITTTHLEDFSESWLKTSSVLKVSNGKISKYE
ncbi:MAG: DNA replication/repair protein RecF [Candidatus Sericytochromatia bacterium]